MSTNVDHGPDWSDWQEGDDDPSCKCGFNGSQRECAADRISRAFAHGVNFVSGVVL